MAETTSAAPDKPNSPVVAWDDNEREWKWREEERDYGRKQAKLLFWTVVCFVGAMMAVLVLSIMLKHSRESMVLRDRNIIGTEDTSSSRAAGREVPPEVTSRTGPPLVVISPGPTGEVSRDSSGRTVSVQVDGSAVSKVLDALFDGGKVIATDALQLKSKLAEAGIRVGEDTIKQMVAAIFRPKAESKPSAFPVSTDRASVVVSCGDSFSRSPPSPSPPRRTPPKTCPVPPEAIATPPNNSPK